MDINNLVIVRLREQVKAAQNVFDLAVTLHEVWKPAANDKELHARLGNSYATQAFNVVRVALRRETILALMRLWDNDVRAIGMPSMAETLREADVMNAFVNDRASRLGISGAEDEIRRTLSEKVDAITAIVEAYGPGGKKAASLKVLRKLRNQRLAHTQVKARAITNADAIDRAVETFYQDNAQLISGFMSVVSAIAYDPLETSDVYRFYAKFFWASVHGEGSAVQSDDQG